MNFDEIMGKLVGKTIQAVVGDYSDDMGQSGVLLICTDGTQVSLVVDNDNCDMTVDLVGVPYA